MKFKIIKTTWTNTFYTLAQYFWKYFHCIGRLRVLVERYVNLKTHPTTIKRRIMKQTLYFLVHKQMGGPGKTHRHGKEPWRWSCALPHHNPTIPPLGAEAGKARQGSGGSGAMALSTPPHTNFLLMSL